MAPGNSHRPEQRYTAMPGKGCGRALSKLCATSGSTVALWIECAGCGDLGKAILCGVFGLVHRWRRRAVIGIRHTARMDSILPVAAGLFHGCGRSRRSFLWQADLRSAGCVINPESPWLRAGVHPGANFSFDFVYL